MHDRKTYSDDVKVEALKMIHEQELSLAEVGKRLSIPKGTIASWVAGMGVQGIPGTPGEQSREELRLENIRLRKELTEARMEREILKESGLNLRWTGFAGYGWGFELGSASFGFEAAPAGIGGGLRLSADPQTMVK